LLCLVETNNINILLSKFLQLLKPMMLRRLKEDVEKNIAPKEETIIEVCLQHHQNILLFAFVFIIVG